MSVTRMRRLAAPAALVLLLLAQSPVSPAAPGTRELSPLTRDLGAFGFPPSTGAAPGYVDDRACALCHEDLSRSFAEKGMARAFAKPRPAGDIEDFGAPPFLHSSSGQTMAIAREKVDGVERLVFRRWQTGPDGKPIHRIEIPVDWILGSGDHARTYLYRTPGGELYQLPLAWYSQTRSWGMAPGFDRADHQGVLRRVRRECVFCHTAYPELPAGADVYGASQTFPAELPEGIGCQRCHGPGAEHVGWALGGIGSLEEIRASVFNPGRLPVEKRDEVCQACHFQPSVTLSGLRRFGRGDFSYQAGEPLADYLVQVDVEEEGTPRSGRFEINHHPYRLKQSRCFLESAGRLSCLTCHDPHRRVPEPRKVEHYRAACLSCHAEEACSRPEHGTATDATDANAAAPADCAGCHMPRRRTQDVVHVVMTDHKITRRPGGPELLAPLSERDPVLVGLDLLPGAPGGALGEVYRAAAVVRAVPQAEAVAYLEKKLQEAKPAEVEPWLDLAEAQLGRRPAAAEKTLAEVLERAPGHPQALELLATARARQGRRDEAIAGLRELLARHPERLEAELSLGVLLFQGGYRDEAAARLERVVARRPVSVTGWYYLGEIRAAQDRPADAIACWRRTLEVDPTATRAYLALGRILLEQGERAEALRLLRHGARAAAEPAQVEAALTAAQKP
jgi:Tfp pilus assembly protein PilF